MQCPRCGWEMKKVDSYKHGLFEDCLYRCSCGATHLCILPASQSKETAETH